MAITRVSQSSVKEGLEKHGSFYGGLSGVLFGQYESIATVTVGSGGASSVVLDNISGSFQHLQLRWIARGTRSATSDTLLVRFNDQTTNHYQYHILYGDGSSAAAINASGPGSNCYIGTSSAATAAANIFGVGVTDILDYASTSKNKTLRTFEGLEHNGSGATQLSSALWTNSSSAITKMSIFASNANIAQYSQFSLYGVRA